ncbi:AAA family ATPase [Clostridium neonatale]|nr:putative AAA_15 domain-containing protein [Clostridium neonatale]
MFKKNVNNLNVIIGDNGVGKTSIINTIFDQLHGESNEDYIIALKKRKTDDNNEIIIYTKDTSIEHRENEILKGYNIKIENDSMLFDVIPLLERKQDYNQETLNIVYISDFFDYSINSSGHKYENNHAINFSPMHLISYPSDFLNRKLQVKIIPTINIFKIISRMHEICFLDNNDKLIDFPKPDQVKIIFSNIILKIKEKVLDNKEQMKEEEFIINNFNKTEWEKLWYMHLYYAIKTILDLSNYAQYPEKAKKYKEYKNKKENEIDEIIKDKSSIFKKEIKKILMNFAKEDNSIVNIKKKLTSIIKSTQVEKFYCDVDYVDDTDKMSMIRNINLAISTYNELISIKNNDCCDNEKNITLSLKNASKFLENYIIIVNQIDNNNFLTNVLPERIDYLKNNEIFYFSSGQETLIRLFVYINLAVNKIREVKEEDDVSMILLLDEPTNSMHPRMQKKFVKVFSDYLNRYKNCIFHVIITTHSPIITSELTRNHIIYLKKENDKVVSLEDENKPKTFAQNIYNLYRNAFFVEDGLIGSYADSLLMNIYNSRSTESSLNAVDHFSEEEIKYFINEIGEPIIRQQFVNKFEKENNKRLIKQVEENSELDFNTKKEIIKLILQKGKWDNDRN